MPNNKDNQKTGSHNSMSGASDRAFEGQDKKMSPGMGSESGQKSGSSNKGTKPDSSMEDDKMNTAGGREGNFSDKDRGSEDQWSPGSSGSSDT